MSDADSIELPPWAQAGERRRAHIARVTALLDEWADAMHLDPEERRASSPLSVEAYEAYKRQFPPPKKAPRPNLTDIAAIGDFLKEQWGNSVGVTK